MKKLDKPREYKTIKILKSDYMKIKKQSAIKNIFIYQIISNLLK